MIGFMTTLRSVGQPVGPRTGQVGVLRRDAIGEILEDFAVVDDRRGAIGLVDLALYDDRTVHGGPSVHVQRGAAAGGRIKGVAEGAEENQAKRTQIGRASCRERVESAAE